MEYNITHRTGVYPSSTINKTLKCDMAPFIVAGFLCVITVFQNTIKL